MKIQYCSDLHLEFPENRRYLKEHPIQALGEILVLAGDIVPFVVMDRYQDFFTYLSDNFEITYWLPGNHEYYHFDAAEKSGVLKEKIRSNVFLVNDASVVHQDVRLVFSTLWSKISLAHEWQIERSINDFHLIKFNGHRFSSKQSNWLHDESLSFITKEIKDNVADKILVFTHHVPTFLNYPEQYKGDILNEAFAVELYDLIESSSVDFWVYGHHHTNTPDFTIGKTKLLTNQLGYVQRKEHLLFERNKVIDF